MRKFWQKKYISKYTGKEIDDAVAKAGTALQNPMTAAGDLIVGGEDGAAGKLAKGTDGKVLKMVSGAPAWADDASGMSNPMTTAGDLIVGGADGSAERLAKGTDGQVLSMVSGVPAWVLASGGDQHLYWNTIVFHATSAGNMVNLTTIAVLTAEPITAYNTDIIKNILVGGGEILIVQGSVTIGGTTYDGLFIKKGTTNNQMNYFYKTSSTSFDSLNDILYSNVTILTAYCSTHQIF